MVSVVPSLQNALDMRDTLKLLMAQEFYHRNPVGWTSAGHFADHCKSIFSLSLFLSIYCFFFRQPRYAYLCAELYCGVFPTRGSSGYLAKILRCVKFLDRWASMSGRGVSDFNTIMSGLYLSQ